MQHRPYKTAVASARMKDKVWVGHETDLLVLLPYQADMNTLHELFRTPASKQGAKTKRVWCINQSKELPGLAICDNVLFSHASLGCDTTSRLFGLGKGLAVKKVKNDAVLYEHATVFSQAQQVSRGGHIATREKALVSLYVGVKEETLDALRYRQFCYTVLKSSSLVKPQTLPPTSADAE